MKHTPAILKQLHAYIIRKAIRFPFKGGRSIAITGERTSAGISLDNSSAGRIHSTLKIAIPVDNQARGGVESTAGFVIESPVTVAFTIASVLKADTSVLRDSRTDSDANSPDTRYSSPVLKACAADINTSGSAGNTSTLVSLAAGIVSKAGFSVSEAGTSVYESSIVSMAASHSVNIFTSLVSGDDVFVNSTNTLVCDAKASDVAKHSFDRAKSVYDTIHHRIVLFRQRIVKCVAELVDTLCMSVYEYEDTVYVFNTTGKAAYLPGGKRRLIFIDAKDISELRKQLKKEQEANRLISLHDLFTLDCIVPIHKNPIQREFWQIKRYKICYRYIPDQRIYTFRLLGKPSAGPSPPAMFVLQSAA